MQVPFTWKLDHGRGPGTLCYITGFSINHILADIICVTHNARHIRGELVFLKTSYPAGSRKPLIRWIGKTQRDGVMAYG
ncbi:hypothetical protein YC2023_117124 [Brassica napus]